MAKLIVAKFGGSSVKDAQAMQRCAAIVLKNQDVQVVVISATQNTTNQLEFVAQAGLRGDGTFQQQVLSEIKAKHDKIMQDLNSAQTTIQHLNSLYQELETLALTILKDAHYGPKAMDELYALGERMSSAIFADYLRAQFLKHAREVHLIDARKIIKTNSDFQKAEPQIELIAECAEKELSVLIKNNGVVVTQGFIGQDLLGQTTTLGREGSDYTAALLGEAINATEVHIWTDVAGVATTDPRLISEARFIQQLTYDEASALATLGAKVLFPRTMRPTQRKKIPLFVGSSLNPDAGGTWIGDYKFPDKKLVACTLMQKNDQCFLTIVGHHLSQMEKLPESLKIKLSTKIHDVEFVELTDVSITFKVTPTQKLEALALAHSLLV